jgi:hypothetical protein
VKILPLALLCALPLVAVGQTAGGDGTLSAPDHPLSLQECVARAVERIGAPPRLLNVKKQ